PVDGNAHASSAQMLAPNQVRAPAATHTRRMPAKLGTDRLTSDGWTKIEAPTMVPTTMAVACTRPIDRTSTTRVPDFPRAISPRGILSPHRWLLPCRLAVDRLD